MSKNRPPSLWRRTLVIACVSLTLGVACYDFSLVTQVTPLPGPDAAVADGSISDAESDADGSGGECVTCISTSCSEPYAKCTSTPKCEPLLLCSIREGCFKPDANRVACVTKCATETGVAGLSDPAIVALLGMNECATKSCAAACSQ